MGGAARGDDSGGAKGFCGTENCSDVAGILRGDEDDDEGIVGTKKVFEFVLGRVSKGGDALRRFGGGDGVKKFVSGAQNQRGAVEFGLQCGEVAFTGNAREDSFDAQAGADGFGDEMHAFEGDAIVFGARGVERGAKRFQPVIFARSDDDRVWCAAQASRCSYHRLTPSEDWPGTSSTRTRLPSSQPDNP